MTSYWHELAALTRPKLEQLGATGIVLGIVWVVGLWVLYDFMMEAYAELVPEAATNWGILLVVWLLLGVLVYLWRDPHGVRESTTGSGTA